MKDKQVPILLIEDDPLDVENIKRAFRVLAIDNPVLVATSGKEALKLLHGGNTSFILAAPMIILLDLNLPDMGGLELLKQLREDPKLKACSVYVMTASTTEQDILKAYDLNVAGYLVKPLLYEKFLEMVRTLHSFWNLIELPN